METPNQIENLEEVKKRITKYGFGTQFNEKIDDALARGFSGLKPVTVETIGKSKIEYELDINSSGNKMYFNGFKATLHQEGKDPLSHWFKSEDRITATEAHAMMHDRDNPRAVHKTLYDKEGKPYEVWMQINFNKQTPSGNNEVNRYNDKYGYNLLDKLNDYAFKETETPKQQLAVYHLMEHGKDVELTPLNNKEHAIVVAFANPARKSITIMDSQGKYLSHDQFRTAEALERIQQQRNQHNSGNSQTPSSDTTSAHQDVKKNSASEPTEKIQRNARPRVVADSKQNNKGIAR